MWIKAEDVPEDLEGKRAWVYRSGQIEMGWVPRNYSRERKHCGGHYFWPLYEPAPPITDDK